MQPNKQSNYFLNGLFILLVSTVAIIYYFQSKHNYSTSVDKVVIGDSNRKTKLNEVSVKGVPLPPSWNSVWPIDPKRENAINAFPKKIDVTFPSGEIVSVTYRLRDKDYLPVLRSIDIGIYINQFIKLVEQNKNGAAAYEVYRMLANCFEAPRSSKEYYSRLKELLATGKYRYGRAETSVWLVEPDSNGYQNSVYSLQAQFHSCRNVSDKLINERKLWLERAIELNSLGALISSRFYSERYDPIGDAHFYKNAWDAGYIIIGGNLIEGDVSRRASGRPSDPIRTHAYSLVKKTILDGYLKQIEEPNEPYLRLLGLNNYTSDNPQLTPDDLLKAENLAIELIRNNENCCKGPWLRFHRGTEFYTQY